MSYTAISGGYIVLQYMKPKLPSTIFRGNNYRTTAAMETIEHYGTYLFLLMHPPQKQINMFCPNLYMTLMFSMDGVQLYCNKQSNCGVTIWIIFNHHPNCHYKKKYVSPASIIPGPQTKKNSDSFLYPSMHHPAALQKEGLHIWDASSDSTFVSAPFLLWAL